MATEIRQVARLAALVGFGAKTRQLRARTAGATCAYVPVHFTVATVATVMLPATRLGLQLTLVQRRACKSMLPFCVQDHEGDYGAKLEFIRTVTVGGMPGAMTLAFLPLAEA
jgi:hypothetical protein